MKLETRPLTEIFANLAPCQQTDLKRMIAYDLKVTDRSVDNWTKHGMRPGNYSQQRDVARIIDKTLKVRTTVATLFPSK